jgi:two-component system sensor histidine kinase UhpB
MTPDSASTFDSRVPGDIHWEQTFDACYDAIWVLDAEQRVLRCNKASCELFGKRPEEMLGRHCWEVVHNTAAPIPECPFERMFSTRHREEMELCLAGRWYHVTVDPIYGADGDFHGAVHILRDITDQKRKDEELRQLNEGLDARVRQRTAKLAETEKKYRDLVERTLDIPCRIDEQGTILYIGPQIRRYGFDPDDVIGRNFLELVHAEDKSRIAEDFQKTMASGDEFPSVFRVQLPDGDVRWFEEEGTLLRGRSEAPAQINTFLRDVTDRKNAQDREQAVLQRLRAFETAVNQGSAVIFRWKIGPGEWNVDMVTDNVRQFGYEAEELLSGDVSWPGITHPEDVPRLEKEVAGFLQSRVKEFEQQYRLITKGGEIRWIRDRNTFITDEDGNPTHILGIIMDVTDQRRTEEALRESESQRKAVLEGMPAVSYSARIDERSTTLFISPQSEELIGFTPEEYAANPDVWLQQLHPEDRDRVLAEVAQCHESGEPFVSEYRMKRKDGQIVWFRDAAVISDNATDNSRVLHGVMVDVTERKKDEEVRRRQQEKIRRLSAMLTTAQDEEQRRIAAGLHDDVAQLLVACHIKLGIAEAEEEKSELHRIHHEIGMLLREAGEKLRSLSFELSSSTLRRLGLRDAIEELCENLERRYGIRIRIEDRGTIPTLDEAAATVLFKAVRELLFNVVKHSGVSEATVCLSSEEKDALVLCVKDAGKGLPKEVMQNGFSAGDGIGLFGVNERLRDLGGTMHMESAPNVGTSVKLEVPLVALGVL